MEHPGTANELAVRVFSSILLSFNFPVQPSQKIAKNAQCIISGKENML